LPKSKPIEQGTNHIMMLLHTCQWLLSARSWQSKAQWPMVQQETKLVCRKCA